MSCKLSERLDAAFRNDLIRSWFDPDCQVFNETNIIGHSKYRPLQQLHRPDRIVMKGETLTVIDYKFARPDAEHEEQVKAYIDLLRQMYPQHSVRGYLWYVYTGKISKKKGRATLEEFSAMPAPAVINSVCKLNEGADLKGLSVAIHLGIDSSKTKATQKRGRIVRFEKDKVAENFILVLRGTVEEAWLKKAYGADIVKIDEDELDKVLAGEEITPTRKSLTNLYFRW
jgi:superfamily II DNA or RNA helicase